VLGAEGDRDGEVEADAVPARVLLQAHAATANGTDRDG
jgi:hypothetical protein